MEEIFISVRTGVFRTLQILSGHDINFAPRKDYEQRLPCNHRSKSPRESVAGSMSSVILYQTFLCLLEMFHVMYFSSRPSSLADLVIELPTSIQQAPHRVCPPLSLKDLGMGNVRNACLCSPPWPMNSLSLNQYEALEPSLTYCSVQTAQIRVGS